MVYRVKSPGRVIDELETLHNAHGGTAFAATDNIISQSHVKSVLVALANRPPTGNPWRLFYEIKSNTGEDDLRTMARAGVIWVQPGIESLSDAALRLMRKGVSALLNIRLLRNCLEFGMGVTWSIIYGFPGEPSDTYDEAAALVPMIEHLYPPIGCVRIRLDRFSPNFERAAEIGFHDVVPCVSYAAIHDIPGEALRDLAYFFEGHAPDAVREENVERLRLAVTEWRATWFDAALTPQLTMIDVGEGHLIKDTRRCAVEPLYFATAIEGAVLGLLRSPCRAASLGGRLATDYSADAIERALANLRARKFVIEIGGECLSLVCEAGRELFDAEDRSRFPAGYLLPLAAE